MAKSKSKTKAKADHELEGEFTVKDVIRNGKNKYLMVNVLAARACDLNLGARPLVKRPLGTTPMQLAIAEADAGLLKIVKKTPSSEPQEKKDAE